MAANTACQMVIGKALIRPIPRVTSSQSPARRDASVVREKLWGAPRQRAAPMIGGSEEARVDGNEATESQRRASVRSFRLVEAKITGGIRDDGRSTSSG